MAIRRAHVGVCNQKTVAALVSKSKQVFEYLVIAFKQLALQKVPRVSKGNKYMFSRF